MSSRGPGLLRWAEVWRSALQRVEPRFDLGRSRTRWLVEFERYRATRSPRRAVWLAMAAGLVLLVAVPVGWLTTSARSRHPAQVVQTGSWLQTGPGQALPLDLGPGTRIVLEEQSVVHVAELSPERGKMVLLRGALIAQIAPRPGTAWEFVAGSFTVRVTGTRLRVAWNPPVQRFEVSVDEGSVEVQGPLLEGRRRLGAGERWAGKVRAAEAELVPRPSAELPWYSLSQLPVASVVPQAAPRTSVGTVALSWQKLEQLARYREAVELAQAYGLDAIYQSGSAEDLMTLARAARYSGRTEVETAALLACRRRFPGDPRASMAAFLLGRTAAPGAAAQYFATYLREQPGGPLAREAAGRLIEAHALAGNGEAARQAAREYLARYPEGPHAALARDVLARRKDLP